jgi:hypothetical protein
VKSMFAKIVASEQFCWSGLLNLVVVAEVFDGRSTDPLCLSVLG